MVNKNASYVDFREAYIRYQEVRKSVAPNLHKHPENSIRLEIAKAELNKQLKLQGFKTF